MKNGIFRTTHISTKRNLSCWIPLLLILFFLLLLNFVLWKSVLATCFIFLFWVYSMIVIPRSAQQGSEELFLVFVRFHTIKCIYSHYNLLNQPGLWFFFFLNCLVTNFNVMYLIDSHISGLCDAFLFRNFSFSEKSWLIF